MRFLKYLKEMKVPLEEYEFPPSKIANVQPQVDYPLNHPFITGYCKINGLNVAGKARREDLLPESVCERSIQELPALLRLSLFKVLPFFLTP